MSDIATRVSYGNALKELGASAENLVVLDADLAGATMTKTFKDEYPDRFIDCGIAESNMMGVAAGLARDGLVPFVSTFAIFAAGRAFEQVRNSVCYPNLNVKIGATHAGISVGEDGATHQAIEDIALMRAVPNMTVISPADDVEARAAVRAAYEWQGPVYLRFGRLAAPKVYEEDGFEFEIGKGHLLRSGKDLTLIATGLEVSQALGAASLLAEQGIEAEVIDIATIKPLDDALILESVKKPGRAVTVEEHSVIGGLGSAICELLAGCEPVPVCRIGINDEFGQSGKGWQLIEKYGLDQNGIAEKTLEFLQSLQKG